MGNCLSKYPQQIGIFVVRERGRKGPSLKSGPRAEEKARSLGACIARKNNILTPQTSQLQDQKLVEEIDR